MEEWNGLTKKLERVSLTEQNDRVTWKLEVSWRFSTRSIYRLITFGGVKDVRMMEIWLAKIPLKVHIFIWMAWHDRLQTADQLRRRIGMVQRTVIFCGVEESVDHLLFDVLLLL